MRTVEVYPKAVLEPAGWLVVVKVNDVDRRVSSRFEHREAAGVSTAVVVRDLKVVFVIQIGDLDTDGDVFDMLITDDIKPGSKTETVWGNWKALTEATILTTRRTASSTAAARSDVAAALRNRGWTLVRAYQQEADGTDIDEAF